MSSITKGDVSITEDEGINSKYLLIRVPNFASDPSGDPTRADGGRYGLGMTSFLRMGVAATTAEPGDDLLEHAYAVGPVGFGGTLSLPAPDGTIEEVSSAFIDDERNRGIGAVEPMGAAGHGMTSEQRFRWHSEHLKTKGGWRDHSDGNRITTTYGDKVEVVRGNYKLIVLGRQDDPGNAMGHDWSGNHVQDYGQATMPGASVTVEWIQNGYVPAAPIAVGDDSYLGGAWLLINSTERVYQYSRNAGNFREQQWGDRVEAYVGSENPERIGTTDDAGYAGHPTAAEIGAAHTTALSDADLVDKLRPSSKGLPRGNPDIVEKTWANSIVSYTGTESKHIPDMREWTFADVAKSYAGSASHRIGDQYEESWVNKSETKSNVLTSIENSTVGASTTTTQTGVSFTHNVVGESCEITNAGAVQEITTAANTFELYVGTHISVEIAALLEVFLGGKISVDVTPNNGRLEITVGRTKELNFPDDEKIAAQKTISALQSTRRILSDTTQAANVKISALNYALNALVVNLGS